MNRDELLGIIIEAVVDYKNATKESLNLSDSTILIGPDSIGLESIGLVTILMYIESRLAETGIDISLVTMLEENNPVVSINSLADYIINKIK